MKYSVAQGGERLNQLRINFDVNAGATSVARAGVTGTTDALAS